MKQREEGCLKDRNLMIIVRHGEIFTKSPFVRNQLVQRLANNIRKALPRAEVEVRRWRLYVKAKDERKAQNILQHVFGIISVSKAIECRASMAAIRKEALRQAKGKITSQKSFAVRAQRLSKDFRLNSMQIAGEVGALVKRKTKARVDLDSPDVEIFIELYRKKAHVFLEAQNGPGGLPLGSAGRIVLLLKDGNSVLAGWMMMKRGAKLVCTGNKRLLAKLRKWSYGCPPLFFKRPADELCRWKRCNGIITGTRSVKEFCKLSKAYENAVFAPLIGLSEAQLAALRKAVR